MYNTSLVAVMYSDSCSLQQVSWHVGPLRDTMCLLVLSLFLYLELFVIDQPKRALFKNIHKFVNIFIVHLSWKLIASKYFKSKPFILM